MTIILCNGEFPKTHRVRDILENAAHVVCCDGAASRYVRYSRRAPDAIVGDLDSLSAAYRRRYGRIIVHNPGQEDNDLAKAFTYCLARGWRDIVILGGTGRREDHTIANVGWLAEFAIEVPQISMVSDCGIFSIVLAPGGVIATKPGMQISFFSFDWMQTLNATGVKFPVDKLRMANFRTAALNEATGERVTLTFAGAPIVVFRAKCGL